MAKFSPAQIRELEIHFVLSLPPFYTQFLAEHDERFELIDLGESGPLGENELMTDIKELIELNTDVRDPNLRFFGRHPWPNEYFAIGKDAYGCHYFLDTTGKHPGVLFQDSDNWDIEPVADDLPGFIKYLEDKNAD